MFSYTIRLFKAAGDNPSKFIMADEISIEAADDEEAERRARQAELPSWEDGDFAVVFSWDGRTIWPVSTRVNTPKNDDADLLVPFVEASADAPPDGNST